MRPRTALAAGVIAATVTAVALSPPVPSAAVDIAGDTVRAPRCAAASVRDFPIDTRMRGGPAALHPGGGFGEWTVELANRTDKPCRNIHPVLVLTARDRGLTRDRVSLEFYDTAHARWRPAELETSGEDEVVAVLDADATSGFVVPGRGTVPVGVRLALAPDTPPNEVVVNAAVIQRHGDDGDWVGESDDYRFTVTDGAGDDGAGPDQLAATGAGPPLGAAAALGSVLLGAGLLTTFVVRRPRPPGR
ncbi:hypothetical protein [Streptomyces yaizuensis]|uniref:Gram-positive cocci surface proteins LPxTG domain-containing protein n=1 Tax=Streptomyces yaizuensis TaxID=2989713 RepID=A0ABQ5NT27_9ACTN|nr:hypothetical protein [Streptomyces sp. YSPA8]GLF93526.1 hypothetical protein SYYSPA8_04535 [Streptomyces sp. YSPA8]